MAVRVDVERVVTDADRVRHKGRAGVVAPLDTTLKIFDHDLLLQDRAQRTDAARLANIGADRAAVRRVEEIGAQTKLGITCAAGEERPGLRIFAGAFGLEPVDIAP